MSSEPPHQHKNTSGLRIVAYILISVGVLIMLAAGSCSLLIFGSMGIDAEMLALAVMVSGVPIIVGFGVLMVGRHLLRKSRAGEDLQRSPQ